MVFQMPFFIHNTMFLPVYPRLKENELKNITKTIKNFLG